MNRRIYKGIPDSLRGEVWYRLLDIGRIKQEQNGVYEVYSTFFQKKKKKKKGSMMILPIFLHNSFLPIIEITCNCVGNEGESSAVVSRHRPDRFRR